MEDHLFESGARRSTDADAARYDLISPVALRAVAETYAEGAGKYAPFNWEMGMPVHDLLNHAIQHIYNFLGGDRAEPHLAHAAWGLLAAIHSHECWPDLNAPHLRDKGCTLPWAVREETKRVLKHNTERRAKARTKSEAAEFV